MDEKKHVGFIPGLALLLAALALVLIAIGSVKQNVSEDDMKELEKAMDIKINGMNESVLTMIRGDAFDRRVGKTLLARDVDSIEMSLGLLAKEDNLDPGLKDSIKTTQAAVAQLKEKLNPKPVVAAPVVAAPVVEKKEEAKKEVKKEEVKKEKKK